MGVRRRITKTLKRQGTRPYTQLGSGLTLPRQGLLFHAKAPNSDNLLNNEETLTDEELLDIGYALPTSVYAAVGGTGAWFSDATTPITRLMSDILADPTTNEYQIGASPRGGVWVFDPYTVWDATIVKAQKYAKATTFYSSTPTAYFNGVSIAGSTSFDSGALGTNPGQWVLGNQGLPGDPMVLVNAGVDVPAIEGARWTGTAWTDTYTDGTPICPTTTQPTRTFDAGFTTAVAGTTYAAYDRSNPLLMPGMLSEPARTNYFYPHNSFTTNTGGTAVVEFADGPDGVALSATKLTAVDASWYAWSGVSGLSAGDVTVSCWVKRISGSSSVRLAFNGIVASANLPITDAWTKLQFTANATVVSAGIARNSSNELGSILLWGFQVEQGAFSTSTIKTTTTALTRAGTVSSWPTLGKIRSNNMAFRMTVVPRGVDANYPNIFGVSIDASNRFQVYMAGNIVILEKRIAAVSATAAVGVTNVVGRPLQIIFLHTSAYGIQIAAREHISGVWGEFSDSSVTVTSPAKLNQPLPASYQLGASGFSNGQYTGNISELDTLLIPSNITDPLAWAKDQWGIA